MIVGLESQHARDGDGDGDGVTGYAWMACVTGCYVWLMHVI